MQFKYRKIPYWKYVPIIVIAILFYKFIDNIEYFFNGIKSFFSVMSYLFWAFAIAYILNPLMVFLEKKTKIRRGLSILIIYTLFSGLIVFAVMILAPIILDSVNQLNKNFSYYVKETTIWAETKISQFEFIDNQFNIGNYLKDNMENIIKQSQNLLVLLMNYVFTNIMNITSTIIKLILGITISIYLLYEKESIISILKKSIVVFLKKEKATSIISFGQNANSIFSRYIVGKIIVAFIISLICLAFSLIFNIPYPFLISIIVGVFNLIPYFGTLIGIVPAVLITLFISPIKAIWLLVFLLVLGQVDGTVISPKIIGDKVGLSPILIMVAITIGGAIYGVFGMFISVPFMALFKSIYLEFINKRLNQNKLDI